MTPILGCIADDFTGATDLAGVLVANGMTASVILDRGRSSIPDTRAVIAALKIRTVPAQIACRKALDNLKWLQQIGCSRFYFKYCSTFDSRPDGNIGHVIDAMMHHLGTNFTIACPAFPANGRTVYQANLFVHGQPLSESSMRYHPLTPMSDSNLVRVLQAQTAHKVGNLPYQVVARGADAVRAGCAQARNDGVGILVLDTVFEEDLRQIAIACDGLILMTGASGIALGLPAQLEATGSLTRSSGPKLSPPIEGYQAILSGSCSLATQRQVAAASRRMPTFQVDPVTALSQPDMAEQISTWARTRLPNGPVLVSATTDAQAVACAQEKLGVEQTGPTDRESPRRLSHQAGG